MKKFHLDLGWVFKITNDMLNFAQNTNYLVRRFITAPFSGKPERAEPTFLTFSIDFAFENYSIPHMQIGSSPLFAENGTYSAQRYLSSKGFRAEYWRLKKFREILSYLTLEAPWFFQSISGLNTLWEGATDMEQNYKGKEKVITIETLESLDLSITYLADLYRKSVYDTLYMRELVPENLRFFQVDIYVAEFRDIRVFDPAKINLLKIENRRKYNTFFEEHMTFYKFTCHLCEFDFSQSFAGGDTLSVHDPGDPATNQFDIKVNTFLEQHSFGFHDILTAEKWSKHKGGTTNYIGKYPEPYKTDAHIGPDDDAKVKLNLNQIYGMMNDVKFAASQLKNFDPKAMLANNPLSNTGRNFANFRF